MKKQILPLIFLLLTISGSFAQFGLDKKVISVDIVSSQDKVIAGEEFKIAISIKIEKGLHINSDSPKEEFQIPTMVEFESVENISFGKPLFPEAELKAFSFSEEKIAVFEDNIYVFSTISTSPNLSLGLLKIKAKVSYQGCDDTVCFPPGEESIELEIEVVPSGSAVIQTNADIFSSLSTFEETSGQPAQTLTAEERKAQKILEKGLGSAIFAFLLVGLALNLTPCVYPIIPLTVSYFGGQSNKSRGSAFISALAYLIGIAVAFALLGLISGLAGKQWGFLFQSPWFIIVIVSIILAMAASMFGAFEITVPSALMTKLGGARQGIFGALIMGLTVGVVIAPCAAGIIIGLVGLIAKMGLVVKGTILFFMMGIGLGLPYLVLATFSGLLNKLPQSGMWMVWIRKFFGILLIGVAIYFIIPQLDQIYDKLWFLIGILGIFGGLLLGFLDHDSGYTKNFKIGRGVFGIILIVLSINWVNSAIHSKPSDIDWIKYKNQSIEEMLTDSKPVFFDFYADWCAPCKQLDRETFSENRVVEKSKMFNMVKVDCTAPDANTKALMEKFGVTGMPTLIFLSKTGQELDNLREIGFIGPDNFITSMENSLTAE